MLEADTSPVDIYFCRPMVIDSYSRRSRLSVNRGVDAVL